MFERLKGNIIFEQLMKRPNIDKAYAMVPPTDSWYDTITTVHNSLAEIQKLSHENWEITSHDGLKLCGIYYPCEGSRKTMIWIHGYTSHAERESAFPSLFYRSMGFNVLIPYLRAHGISEGKYIAFGGLEYRDMMLWADKVNQLHPKGQIVFHGLSMGGGIALDLANQAMENVKCIVVDAPSLDADGIFRYVAAQTFKKGHEAVAQAALARYQKEFGCDARDFNRLENIQGCRYPLLLSAGSMEGMDAQLSELCEKCPQPTSFVILPGCNHGNGMYKQTQMYQSAIRDFMDRYIGV